MIMLIIWNWWFIKRQEKKNPKLLPFAVLGVLGDWNNITSCTFGNCLNGFGGYALVER